MSEGKDVVQPQEQTHIASTERTPRIEKETNPYVSRFRELQENTAKRIKKIELLSEKAGGKVKKETEQPKAVMLEEVTGQARDLDDTSPSYLENSGRILADFALLEDQADATLAALQEQLLEQTTLLSRHSQKLEAFSAARGWSKISALAGKRVTHRTIANLESQIATLSAQLQEAEAQKQRVAEQKAPLKKTHEEVFIKHVFTEVESVVADYESFAKDFISEGTTIHHMQDVYIQTVLKPILVKKGLDEEAQGVFLEQYKSFLTRRENPEERDAAIAEGKAFIRQTFYRPSEDAFIQLLAGKDEEVVEGMIVSVTSTALRSMTHVGDQALDRARYNSISHQIYSLVAPTTNAFHWERKSFRQKLKEQETLRTDYEPQMDLWQGLKQSGFAQEVLGAVIAEQDEVYSKQLTTRVFADNSGATIDLLKYFPRPDVIRALILLSADNHHADKPRHANRTLQELTKRQDWQKLLDASAKVYPELNTAYDQLLHWDYQNEAFDASELTEKLALAILQNPAESYQLKQVALNALQNDTLFKYLDIDADVQRDLLIAERLLSRSVKNSQVEGAEDNPVYTGFRIVIKDVLLDIANTPHKRDALVDRMKQFAQTVQSYEGNNQILQFFSSEQILSLAFNSSTDQTHVLSFPQEAPLLLLPENIIARNYMIDRLLKSEFSREDAHTANMLVEKVGKIADSILLQAVLDTKKLSVDLALQLPTAASGLMSDDMTETRSFVIFAASELIHDVSDLRFVNTLIGRFGKRADAMIRGYHECLKSGVITTEDKQLVLDFTSNFRIISPKIMEGYKGARDVGGEAAYIARLHDMADNMISVDDITDEDRESPYYHELLRHVFANNSGHYTSYGRNEQCRDRRGDLEAFTIQPRYTIDLLSQSKIYIKEGEALDPRVQEETQAPIYALAERMKAVDYEPERMKIVLQEDIQRQFNAVIEHGGFSNIAADAITTPDEKLFLILADAVYGTKSLTVATVKQLMLTYEFVMFDDVRAYIQGTQDRVSLAGNRDYALLCELGTLYSDRVKEVNRRLVQSVWENPEIARAMPEYFADHTQALQLEQRQEKIDKMQVGKLGLSEGFIRQLARTMQRRRKSYTDDQLKEIITRYEAQTGGLESSKSASKDKTTQAFYGQLRAQRQKTIAAWKELTGEEIDPKEVSLGALDLQSVIDAEEQISNSSYNDESFAAYTIQQFIDLFAPEREAVAGELDKFVSESGSKQEILHGYITKNKTSAHARMVGGVCVSGDNPGTDSENLWDMPNYFQMVYQDPETSQCQGLSLLHYFEQNGKKILSASLNPSSTYVYSVDEEALFKGLLSSLEQFASENNFDAIVLSQNHAIRTNRTGGAFERAMDARVQRVNKQFRFDKPQQFSFRPNYQLRSMDIVWEKPTD